MVPVYKFINRIKAKTNGKRYNKINWINIKHENSYYLMFLLQNINQRWINISGDDIGNSRRFCRRKNLIGSNAIICVESNCLGVTDDIFVRGRGGAFRCGLPAPFVGIHIPRDLFLACVTRFESLLLVVLVKAYEAAGNAEEPGTRR